MAQYTDGLMTPTTSNYQDGTPVSGTPDVHASTHESGGSDQVSHDNLFGAGSNSHSDIDSHIASFDAHSGSENVGNIPADWTPDIADGDVFVGTFTEDTTIRKPNNIQSGAGVVFELTNGGDFGITWDGTVYKWGEDTPPVLTESGKDVVSCFYDGTHLIGVLSIADVQ